MLRHICVVALTRALYVVAVQLLKCNCCNKIVGRDISNKKLSYDIFVNILVLTFELNVETHILVIFECNISIPVYIFSSQSQNATALLVYKG